MPAVARCENIDTISTGHACDGTAQIQGCLQSTVYANGNLIAVQGDAIAPHTILVGGECVPHSAVINAGSGTVFINGIAVARVGDSADSGTIITGSGNIVVGG